MTPPNANVPVVWDLQSFLQDMRKEMNDRHDQLSEKVDRLDDSLSKELHEQDLRITAVETSQKTTTKWIGAVAVAGLPALGKMVWQMLRSDLSGPASVLKP